MLTTLASALCSLEKSQVPFHPRFPRWPSGKEPACHCRRCRRHEFNPWFRKIPQRRAWQPTPVFLPGESHGQKSLVGHSPRRHSQKRLSTRARARTHTHTHTLPISGPLHSSSLCLLFAGLFTCCVLHFQVSEYTYSRGAFGKDIIYKVGSLVSQLVSIKTPSLFIPSHLKLYIYYVPLPLECQLLEGWVIRVCFPVVYPVPATEQACLIHCFSGSP